jgi:hypothetical protein
LYSISSCRQLGVHTPTSNQQRYQHEERSHPSFHIDVMLEILPCTVALSLRLFRKHRRAYDHKSNCSIFLML